MMNVNMAMASVHRSESKGLAVASVHSLVAAKDSILYM